jgi:hypothetical protein
LETKKTEPAFDIRNVDIRQYSGQYAVPGDYAHAEVQVKNDTLFFSLKEKPQFKTAILPVDLHRFCFAGDPGKSPMFRFGTDDSGNVVNLEFLEFRFKKK